MITAAAALAAVAVGMGVAPATAVSDGKYCVYHVGQGEAEWIEVSANALDTHIEHGDTEYYPGRCVE